MKFKNSRKGKNPLAIVVSCILVFAVLAGLSAFSSYRNQDTKVINPTFEVGGLDTTTGKFVDTDGSIYTKESFECQGLIIKLDFDSTVEYQVFYYDDVDEYIGVCSPVYDKSVELAVPENAVYARIMVTPIWDEELADEDRVCHWYDVAKYASQLEITVNKDQGNAVENVALFDHLADMDVRARFSANEISALGLEYSGFIYSNNYFENETVTRIGLPVGNLKDYTQDQVFTVYVIKEASDYKTVEIVDEYTFTISANTYSSNNVHELVYFDTSITVGEGETLMFGATTDGIVPHYQRTIDTVVGDFWWKANTENAVKFASGSLIFDIYIAEEK